MTQGEFIKITSEIEQFYDKELTTEQRRIWFEELKEITQERYRQISREIYKTSKFFPKLADVIEINQNLPFAKKQNAEEKTKCPKCNGVGMFTYKKTVEGNEYVFACRCDCKNGMRVSQSIPGIMEIGLLR